MSVFPARQYRDPLDALLAAEEETCKGCRYRRQMTDAVICTNPRRKDDSAEERCPEYEEAK